MIKIYKKIFKLLSREEKNIFFYLNIIDFFKSVIEIISLATIAAFLSKAITINNSSEKIPKFISILNHVDLIYLGIFTLLFYLINFILTLYLNTKSQWFSQRLIQSISNILFRYFIFRDWLYYTKYGVANINKSFFDDLATVAQNIIVPSVNVLNKSFLVISIVLALLFLNFRIAIISIFIYGCAYFLISFFFSKIINKLSAQLYALRSKKYNLLHNVFSGFKEVIIFNLKKKFIKKFYENSEKLILPEAYILASHHIPRILIETITYLFIISSILIILILGDKNDVLNILPIFAVYGLSALKLLPAFQQIYLSVARIKASKIAFYSIENKLAKGKNINYENIRKETEIKKIQFKKSIQLRNISFSYLENDKKVLKKINLVIKKNNIIGLAGYSGSGKSTLADILSGLLFPNKGQFLVDNNSIGKSNIKNWQNNVGIVPQSPFLSNDTIFKNITFKDNFSEKDKNKVLEIIRRVQLDKWLKNKNLNSLLDDRGNNLSGGERQRLSLARCLYFNNDFIILDEATNSLDPIIEAKIVNSFRRILKDKTILMISHRMNTLKICDEIILMKSGKIVSRGSFKQLLKKNKYFQNLVKVKYNDN